MKTTIYMVRHGETEWNTIGRFQGITDVPLNGTGREQAGYAREALKDVPFDFVCSSPLARAHETAEIICEKHPGLTISDEAGFLEQNIGEWEGQHFQDIKAKYGDNWELWIRRPSKLIIPGGETFQQVQERALEAFHRLVSQHQGQTILLTSHMVCLSTMLDHFAGVSIDDIWKHPISNAGTNIVTVTDGQPPCLERWNYDDYMPEKFRRRPTSSKKILEAKEA